MFIVAKNSELPCCLASMIVNFAHLTLIETSENDPPA